MLKRILTIVVLSFIPLILDVIGVIEVKHPYLILPIVLAVLVLYIYILYILVQCCVGKGSSKNDKPDDPS